MSLPLGGTLKYFTAHYAYYILWILMAIIHWMVFSPLQTHSIYAKQKHYAPLANQVDRF